MPNSFIRLKLLVVLIFLFHSVAFSQCYSIRDGNGTFTNTNPYWIHCSSAPFNLVLETNMTIGSYTIDWGDGTNASGAGLVPPAILQHIYPSVTDTFNFVMIADGCTINGVIVLERNPLASIQLPLGATNFGCTPALFKFINSANQISQTTSFTWDFGDGSTIQSYGDTNAGDTINHTYLPGVGTISCDLEVTLVATNYCGTSSAKFRPLKVWDKDAAVLNASTTVLCYPDTVFQFYNNSIRNCLADGNNGQRYEYWNFGNYWGKGYDSIIAWRPWNPPIINPPPIGFPGPGSYNIFLIDSSFCGQDTAFMTVSITTPPIAGISSNKDTICAGEAVTFINTSTGGATSYRWNFDQGTGFQYLSGANKTRVFTTSGNYTIALIAGTAGSATCMDSAFVDLYVHPSPDSDFNFNNNNGCDSMLVNFTDNSTGAIQWRWTFGNGNTYVGNSPPIQKYGSPGTYSIKLVTTNIFGCRDSIIKSVVVKKSPIPAFTATSVCVNELASFTDISSSATGDPILAWNWNFGNGSTSAIKNPFTTYLSGGAYWVVLEVFTANCSTIDSMQVVVENKPTANFSSSISNGCSPINVNFTNTSSANSAKYKWDFGDGSLIDTTINPSHIFKNFGTIDTTFQVQLIASTTFGCSDTMVQNIKVSPIPKANFTSNAVVDCGPISVIFNNQSTGDSLVYQWNFGDGSAFSLLKNPTHIFQNQTLFPVSYTVQLIAQSKNSCTDTINKIITVNPEPVFDFTVSPDSGCSPILVQFSAAAGAVNYRWSFGDGINFIGVNPSHTYVNNTINTRTFKARLIAQNSFGCFDTTFKNIVVYPTSKSQFDLDTFRGCQPLKIRFSNNSIGNNTYSWNYGDGTSNANANANFNKTFTNNLAISVFRTVELISQNVQGCADTTQKIIEVYPKVKAEFFADSIGCSPFKIDFNNLSIGANGGVEWFFGNGNLSNATNTKQTFNNSGLIDSTYNVKLRVRSFQQCLDSTFKTITVHAKPNATFIPDVSAGCQPLQVQFTNNSTIADSCFWDFGNGNFNNNCSPTVNNTFYNLNSTVPVNYQATLRVKTANGCSDTLAQSITVNPKVIAEFTSDSIGCSPLRVAFLNLSTGASNSTEWFYGDGNSSVGVNPVHTFTNTSLNDTTFTIKLKIGSIEQCYDSTFKTITVHPKPVAAFLPDVMSGCQPLQVQFNNSSILADSCFWDFGNGNFNNNCSPTVNNTFYNLNSTVPVNYQTTLRVKTANGCSDTLAQTITVNPKILAQFTSDSIGCSPLRVTFNSQSIGTNGFYEWIFGDGQIGSGNITTHSYINSGQNDTTYIAKLKVKSPQQCEDSATKLIKVFAKPIANYTTNSINGCQPLQVQFSNTSVNADSCRWEYGDGFGLNNCTINSAHTFYNLNSIIPINFTAILKVFTDEGCSDSIRKSITVNPKVVADFTYDSLGCSPYASNFQSVSFGGNNYNWSFDDGTFASGQLANHTFRNSAATDSIYNVQLVVNSLYNCADTVYKPVLVHPTPLVNFNASPKTQLYPSAKVFISNNTNAGPWAYEWSFGDSSTSNSASPLSHTYSKWGTYRIWLKANSNFCADSTFEDISINAPKPLAAFNDSASGCEPLSVQFYNNSLFTNSYEWSFGDGAKSKDKNPLHSYNRPGLYDVQLKVFGDGGSDTLLKNDYIEVYPRAKADFTINLDIDENIFIPNDPLIVYNQSNNADRYLWNFGDGDTSSENSPVHFYKEVGAFEISLVAISDKGCSDTYTLNRKIKTILEGEIILPNAFTPNPNSANGGKVDHRPSGRKVNDVFYAIVRGTKSFEMTIFNKWGELVFASDDPEIGWDGYYKNELSKQDTYVWQIKATFKDGRVYNKAGEFLLLR